MNDHSHSAGPAMTAFGFVLGFITNILDWLGSNASGITALFMIISVIGGLWLSWDRNKILRSKDK